MTYAEDIDLKIEEIENWAANECTALIARKSSYEAGDGNEIVAPASLKRSACHNLIYCTGEGRAAPWKLIELLMELLDGRVPPELPVSRHKMTAWRIAVEIAARYPCLPDPSQSNERPRQRATLKEMETAAGVTRNTIRAWIKLPEFEQAWLKQRKDNSMSLTEKILSAPLNAQNYQGADFLMRD